MEKKNQEYETLDNNYKNACDKGAELEERLKKREEQAQKDMQELNKRLYEQEADFKTTCDKLELEKKKEIQNLQRLHRTELDKIEKQRQQELLIKNQELKDLSATF